MAGKGDKPRSCFSKSFKENYEQIKWKKNDKKTKEKTKGSKKIFVYF